MPVKIFTAKPLTPKQRVGLTRIIIQMRTSVAKKMTIAEIERRRMRKIVQRMRDNRPE